MKNPSDLKDNEELRRFELRKQNRRDIEVYFNKNIFSSDGGTIEIIGRINEQTKEDYSKFLKEWFWETEFGEKKKGSWSMTTKSETEYIVTVLTIKPMEDK